MRVRILKDTATVGRMLAKGSICDIQQALANALIASDKAEDAFKVATTVPPAPAPAPEIVEVIEKPAPVEKPNADKQPAGKKRATGKKRAAAKKSAGKKGK